MYKWSDYSVEEVESSANQRLVLRPPAVLIAHWAANAVQDIRKIQDTLVSIFKYFKYSAVRNNKLKELKNIMMEKVRRFKKPTAVRWLSLHEAVDAAEQSWGCLVLTLENEATSGEGDTALALSLLRQVKTYKFIAMLCILKDVLDPLMKCSKYYQRDDIDIDLCTNMLEESTFDALSTLPDHPGPNLTRLHDSLDNESSFHNITLIVTERQKVSTTATCNAFIQSLAKERDKRFPAEDMSVIKALDKILNPKHLPIEINQLIDFGHEHLQKLCEAFPQVDADRVKDYRMFKLMLNNNRVNNLQQMCTRVINHHGEEFPDFAILANISVVISLTSVPCERAFSVQNSVLNRKRSRLSNTALNNKMLLISESRLGGGDINGATARKFSSDKERRQFLKSFL